MTTNAVDPNQTPLPRAVRERMERINAHLESSNPGAAPPPPQPAAGEQPPTVQTDPTEGAQPPAPPAPPAAPAADPRENDPVYWKQRFKVTEGMLKSFQERQTAEHERKDREINELRDKVRSLEANRTPSKVDLTTFFTAEQIERFGEDQCEAMAAAAIKAAGQQAQHIIDAEVKPIRDRSRAEAEQAEGNREAAFWDKLVELQPNYAEINADQAWLAWLTESDETTGMVRQDILDQHRAARNAIGVAKLFKSFEAGTKRPAPPVAPPRNAATTTVQAPAAALAMGYPTREEIRDFTKRSATIRNPRDPRFVTDKERADFEARLRSQAAA